MEEKLEHMKKLLKFDRILSGIVFISFLIISIAHSNIKLLITSILFLGFYFMLNYSISEINEVLKIIRNLKE